MRTTVLHAVAWYFALAGGAVLSEEPMPKQAVSGEVEFFERRVRPILAENCFSCHGPKKQMAGLRLDSAEALRKGSENGEVVKPGDPEHSRLVLAIRQTGELKMPPKKSLPPEAIETLTQWVKQGASWPQAKAVDADASDAWKRHWAFQPIRNPAPPPVKNTAWPRTSIV
jgi:mono/diheme cytochrome c family protein